MGEDALLHWLRQRAARSGQSLIGDDAALLPRGERWAITVDSQVEGVHFETGLDEVHLARRLLAVNLSDLAASGARPAYAFLALSAPKSFRHRRFFRGLLDACKAVELELAGGDLARSPQAVLSLTLLGERAPGGRFLQRAEARAGDRLWLGGTVGEAALGLHLRLSGAQVLGRRVDLGEVDHGLSNRLRAAARRAVRRHLLPRPQLELGGWLAAQDRVGGVMDVSDGLGKDLHRLCRIAGVGAEVGFEALPLAEDFPRLAGTLGLDAAELALFGGEDYVLLFTLPEDLEPPASFGCNAIGRILQRRTLWLQRGGKHFPLEDRGWDHLTR